MSGTARGSGAYDAHRTAPFVRPESVEEVADIVRGAYAAGRRVRVTGAERIEDLSGAGEGARGVADGGFAPAELITAEPALEPLLLSTASLSGVLVYEPADLTVTAGAGTPLRTLAEVLAPHRQWLPFDPPHRDDRTLGGLVATGTSGPLASGYGALRNHVLGATVVCGDGRVLHLGGRVVKNVAGFDLLRPWVGSRGRLGVITSVCVRLFPLPEVDRVLVRSAPTPADLVDAARAVASARVLPASTVLVRSAEEGQALLMVRLHGAPATVDADQRTLEAVVGRGFDAGDGVGQATRVRDLPEVAHSVSGGDVGAPAAIPRGVGVAAALPSRLGDVLTELERALGPVPFMADVPAGRVRFEFGPDRATALPELRRSVEGLGGALAVERWAGATVPDAVTERSPGERALADRVRRVFDPHGTMLA